MDANEKIEECAKMVDEMFEDLDKADQIGPMNAMIGLAQRMREMSNETEKAVWLVLGISDEMYGEPKIDCFCFTQNEAQRKSNKLNKGERHFAYYVVKVIPNRGIGGK